MSIHIYWGEDEFLIAKAVKQQMQLIDPSWFVFNYRQFEENEIAEAITDVLTSPVGNGNRLVYVANCTGDVFEQLATVWSFIPSTNTLLLTFTSKPDARNKLVKSILSNAQTM